MDLHIGDIFLPGVSDNDLGSHKKPLTQYPLPEGHTAVVVTAETLHLKGSIGAFGFPPSSVSFQGLLTTNPGHVDPGYSGRLRFAVINMGKATYTLRRGAIIASLFFFDWTGRRARRSKTVSVRYTTPKFQGLANKISICFPKIF